VCFDLRRCMCMCVCVFSCVCLCVCVCACLQAEDSHGHEPLQQPWFSMQHGGKIFIITSHSNNSSVFYAAWWWHLPCFQGWLTARGRRRRPSTDAAEWLRTAGVHRLEQHESKADLQLQRVQKHVQGFGRQPHRQCGRVDSAAAGGLDDGHQPAQLD